LQNANADTADYPAHADPVGLNRWRRSRSIQLDPGGASHVSLPRLQRQASRGGGWIPFDLVVAEDPAGVVAVANCQSSQSLQKDRVVLQERVTPRHSAYTYASCLADTD
jgi:hypothetical protein